MSEKPAQDPAVEWEDNGRRVRKLVNGWTGNIVQIYSLDYAAMTDHDVAVEWDNGRRTSERLTDLEAITEQEITR